MTPFVDLHVHLLAGLDDGPRTMEDAVAMCKMAWADGTRLMAATSHQNDRWAITPEQIRTATAELREALARENVDVQVIANSEVTARPETPIDWTSGRLLTVADKGHYLLIEMPKGIFVDLMPTVKSLRESGVRTILAHPEKEPDFLFGDGLIESMLDAGCLVQVSCSSITEPKDKDEQAVLKSWFKRGIVHFVASDGHSPKKRKPLMKEAHREVASWVGFPTADRLFGNNPRAVMNGMKLRTRPPLPPERKSWFANFWANLTGAGAK
jgi:protein-tyrosine phosphatase